VLELNPGWEGGKVVEVETNKFPSGFLLHEFAAPPVETTFSVSTMA